MTFMFFIYFISFLLFPVNGLYLQSINLPCLNSHIYIFSLFWIISFTLIVSTVFTIIKYEKVNNNYLFILIINFILNQLFSFTFFQLNNLIFTIFSLIFILISGLYLYLETKKINKTLSILLIFYLLWLIYNLILLTYLILIS